MTSPSAVYRKIVNLFSIPESPANIEIRESQSLPLTKVAVLRRAKHWTYEAQSADSYGMHPAIIRNYESAARYYYDLLEEMDLCGATTTDQIR